MATPSVAPITAWGKHVPSPTRAVVDRLWGVLFSFVTIFNNREGFDVLFQKIQSVAGDLSKVKVGLKAIRHYSYNLLGFLFSKSLLTYAINPLHTDLYRKNLSLRKTKTDNVDARTIASVIISDVNLKSYSDISYHNKELKSLTRYRYDKAGNLTAVRPHGDKENPPSGGGRTVYRERVRLRHPRQPAPAL